MTLGPIPQHIPFYYVASSSVTHFYWILFCERFLELQLHDGEES